MHDGLKNALNAETQPEVCVVIRFLFSINYKCAYSIASYNCFQDSFMQSSFVLMIKTASLLDILC